jgi:quinol monooxygenase YgiN
MALRLVVNFKAQPGKGQDFANAFGAQAKITYAEKGCEQYDLFRGTADPDTLVLLERWTSQADLDAHMAAMQARGGSVTSQFIAGPPTLERYEVE